MNFASQTPQLNLSCSGPEETIVFDKNFALFHVTLRETQSLSHLCQFQQSLKSPYGMKILLNEITL